MNKRVWKIRWQISQKIFLWCLSFVVTMSFSLGFLPFRDIEIDTDNSNKITKFIEKAKADNLDSVNVEAISLSTTSSTTVYTTMLNAVSGDFTGGHRYFIYFHMGLGSSSAAGIVNYQVKYGANVQYTGTVEPVSSTANTAIQISWIDVYTQPATPVAVTISFKSGTGGATAGALNAHLLAINLDEKMIENYDYYYNENTTSAQHTTTWTSKASITLNNADGVKDWLVFVMEDLQIDSTAVNPQARIWNGSSGYGARSVEGEDSNERYTFVLMAPINDAARGTTCSIQVKDDATGVNDHKESKIFAFDLNVFDSHATYLANNAVALGSTFTEIATLAYQPAVAGNQVVFSSYIDNVAAANTQSNDRLQFDGTTSPTGWNWTQLGTGKTSYDITDRIFSNITAVVYLNTSSHNIDLDVKEIVGTAQIVYRRSITVFSTLYNHMPQIKTWQWYADEEDTTPGTAYAAENTAPPQVEMGKKIAMKLRINFDDVGGQSEDNNRKKIYYATGSTGSWTEVGSTVDKSKAWRYYNGGGTDNATLPSALFPGTTDLGIHNEQNSAGPSNSDHAANAVVEHEFCLENYNATANTTYYFAFFDEDLGLIPPAIGSSLPYLTTASAYDLSVVAPSDVDFGSCEIGSPCEYYFTGGEEITIRDNRGQMCIDFGGTEYCDSFGWDLTADISTELYFQSGSASCSPVIFTGGGSDDMNADCSSFTGSENTDYKIEIDSHYDASASFTCSLIFSVNVYSPGHGINFGSYQQIEVTNTVFYNGTYIENLSLFVVDVNNFELMIMYVGDETGTIEYNPNTYKWSSDGGSSWGGTHVAITTAAQILNHGVYITFDSDLGHQTGDYWEFTAYPGDSYAIPKSDMYWITNTITGLYDAPTTGIGGNAGEYMSSAVTAASVFGSVKQGLGGFEFQPSMRVYNADTIGNYTGVITFTLT